MRDRGQGSARRATDAAAPRAARESDHDTAAAPVALVTYSTRPRGGVVHTLHLAEALTAHGRPVRVFALGDPDVGFFRPVSAPVTIIPAPPPLPTLEERVFAAIEALTHGLAGGLPGRFGLVHAQDCIAARAAAHLRDAGLPVRVLRTVHHVDDFTTEALIDCQRRSILDPDHLLVVSRHWREQIAAEFHVDARVVTNGVDTERFADGSEAVAASLRSRIGADGPVFLTVGGIEPRKGSRELVEALAIVREHVDPAPTLVVVGGHSFQDHRRYREQVLARARQLSLDDDIRLVGTVSERELAGWYHAVDAFVFPSVKEGFGLVLLEAMAAGLPVVASDIPVFREFVSDGVNALLAPAGNPGGLAAAMVRLATDPALRATLGAAGPRVAAEFTWERCAAQHQRIYDDVAARGGGDQRTSAST